MKINPKLQKYLYTRTTLGIIIGGIGGLLYYKFVGCSNGSCAITSNPYITTLYGTLMGGLLFYKEKKKESKTKDYQEPQE